MKNLNGLVILIRGAGELASGVAHRLYSCHFRLCLTEIDQPQAVRRMVSFCEAVYDGEKEVEGVTAKLVHSPEEITLAWREDKIPLLVDPKAGIRNALKPDVLVDAILAKKNLGTSIKDARLVIGLGPGFTAGKDVHAVIETNRGHNLGRMILSGGAEPNTGIPGEIAGLTAERVFRAPRAGKFLNVKEIGDYVQAGDVVATVQGEPVKALIHGVLRGLLRDGTEVYKGMKAGDVDPRDNKENCYTISDKARAIGGGVLEAILYHFNRNED
ncbi:MAG: EF2563 family selenium-dependent molybdenum hydroxylase system protein [Deltaproteobacteria bacterium]|nr:EF2563 family selenium-dependent molybdenum hydroxylase system protein [Deltaproteobacteria bacterium]MBW2137666.1 EF2563 family selenium-dependent molybdenum hydroxylase system protein [Deltaproteobacteria bacterium]